MDFHTPMYNPLIQTAYFYQGCQDRDPRQYRFAQSNIVSYDRDTIRFSFLSLINIYIKYI